MSFDIALTINGVRRIVPVDDPRMTLLDLLRERLDLTCLALAVSLDGADVTTIEGIAQGDVLHPVQAAFIAHDGFQCGFCTPGQIMSAIGMLAEGQVGNDPERVREGMSGNLCRCGAYLGISAAILDAQARLQPQAEGEAA